MCADVETLTDFKLSSLSRYARHEQQNEISTTVILHVTNDKLDLNFQNGTIRMLNELHVTKRRNFLRTNRH